MLPDAEPTASSLVHRRGLRWVPRPAAIPQEQRGVDVVGGVKGEWLVRLSAVRLSACPPVVRGRGMESPRRPRPATGPMAVVRQPAHNQAPLRRCGGGQTVGWVSSMHEAADDGEQGQP